VRVLLALGPAVGGMARHVANLVRGLDRTRFDVALAGRPDDPAVEVARSHSCPVHPLRFGPSPLRVTAAALRLAGLVRRERCALIHAHGYSAAAAAALARRVAPNAALVCTLHNFVTDTSSRRLTGRRVRSLLSLIARRAHRIITVSDSLREQFAGLPDSVRSKLVTVPNGLDLCRFRNPDQGRARRELDLEPTGDVVGMVGRLAAQKGPLDFVTAAALVARRLPGVRFVLIGDGPLRREVEKLVEQLDLGDRMVLAGYRDDAATLTQAFDVAVVPSVSEGSSLTAMEAMAWGRPVVATAVGGVCEVVAEGETGVLVPPSNPQALADAMVSLLADRERAARLGEAGLRRVEREFSLARIIERTEEIYLAVAHIAGSSRGDGCA